MNRTNFLYFWSLAVGAMDACTGLLLVFVPGLVLRLLAISIPNAEALIFLSWMGVFITGVGISYSLVLKGAREAETVWTLTAWIRLLVSGFLVWKISSGQLVGAWGLVAASDGVVGLSQLLLRHWWKGVRG